MLIPLPRKHTPSRYHWSFSESVKVQQLYDLSSWCSVVKVWWLVRRMIRPVRSWQRCEIFIMRIFSALSNSFQQQQNISNNAIIRDGSERHSNGAELEKKEFDSKSFIWNLEGNQIQQRVANSVFSGLGNEENYTLYNLVSVTHWLGYCQ